MFCFSACFRFGLSWYCLATICCKEICDSYIHLLGLGFNIRGGVDVPYLNGDSGIFIAKVREQGAAAEDGRIKEGDKIIGVRRPPLHAFAYSTRFGTTVLNFESFKSKYSIS